MSRLCIGAVLLGGAAWVAVAAALVTLPRVQRGITHLHWVPGSHTLFGNLDQPQAVWGIVGARNVYLRHRNGQRLGLWHILPSGHQAIESPTDGDPEQAAYFDAALGSGCVVLYFHGNAMSRGEGHRLYLYRLLTAYLGCHVVAPDWRGYADSDGQPSEEAQVEDAEVVWDWLIRLVGLKQRVVVWGHSLGGAVANLFCEALLRRRGTEALPSGLVLHSTLVSLREAAMAYPLALPFTWIPGFVTSFDSFWHDHYLAVDALAKTAATGRLPVLVVHGNRDAEVGVWHGRALHKTAGNSSRLVIINGGTHNDLEKRHAPALMRAVQSWLSGLTIEGS